ncbi:MAG: class I SAM-dependent methyltransferase [Acidimicrobiales bacterium]
MASPSSGGAPGEERLIADQRAYYRQRAPEYDEWWQRVGRYDRGESAARDWVDQVGEVAGALRRFGARGDVLELAGGTGWWTERLAETATALTVVDASLETLELNRRRIGRRDQVDYVVADLFDWSPTRFYDAVFFSFWLSHVPRDRFEAFWHLVGEALGPGGRVFLIDNRRPERSWPTADVVDETPDVQHRTLNDGSVHRLVKIFYEPDNLTARLAELGWRAEIAATPLFIYGTAEPGAD